MPKYNFNSSIKNNPDFLDFLKNECNISDVNSVRDYELDSLIYRFKFQKNDIDENDRIFLAELSEVVTNKKDVVEAYYPGKTYEDLSDADKAVVDITGWHLADKQIDPAEFKRTAEVAALVMALLSAKETEAQRQFQKQNDGQKQNVTSGESRLLTLKKAVEEKQKEQKEQKKAENQNKKVADKTPQPKEAVQKQDSIVKKEQNIETEENRLRSETNLEEDSALAKLRMETLRDMQVISAADYDKYISGFDMNAELKNANEAWAFLDGKEEDIRDEKTYKRNLAEKVVQAGQQRLLTPELAAEAWETIEARGKEKSDDREQADKRKVLSDTMDRLTDNFIRERDYYLLDVTNVADAYSGYSRMFKLRLNELDKQNKELDAKLRQDADNGELKAQKEKTQKQIETYEKCQQNLDILMQPYDEKWNIPDGKKPRDTSIRMNDRARAYVKALDKIKYDENTLGAETMQMVSRFKFRGEKGNIPQFYDVHNPDVKSDTWKEGMAVLPGSRLETVLNLAKNDILMTNLNTDKEISEENITHDLRDGIGEKLFEIYNSEEKILGAVENPRKFIEPEKTKYMADFTARLNNPNQPLSISEIGYQAAMNVQANNTEVYAHRLAEKLGANNSEYVRSVLFEQMENINRRAPLHERSKSVKNRALKRSLFGTVLGAGVAYLGARTFTNATATGGTSLGLSAGMAVVAAVGIGIGATALQYYFKRKEARANGDRHYGFKKFIKDKKVQAALGATVLGAAALVFAKVNAPELAAGCAIGSFGLGVGLRFAQPYRDMRLKGHNKLASFAMGAISAASTLGAGLLGRQHALNNILPNSELIKSGTHNYTYSHKSYPDEINAKAEIWNNSDGVSGGARYTADGLYPSESIYHKSGNYDQILANVQKSMDGWEADAARTNLAKLENAFRLGTPETPIQDGSGRTLGDVLGYVNPDTGKHTNYNDVLQHLLSDPAKPLNHDEVQVMEQVALHMGAGKGDKMGHLIPDVGIKKEDLFSYDTERPHGIINKIHTKVVDLYSLVEDKVRAFGGIIGWAHRDGGAKEKFRSGAKADRVEKHQKKIDVIIPPRPEPKPEPRPEPKPEPRPEPRPEPKPEPRPEPKPEPKPEPRPEPKPENDDVRKYLIDEYKIVYGIDPIEDGKVYKNFCKRVEKEHQSEAPDMPMNDYLLKRREELDNMFLGDRTLLSGKDKTKYQNDYKAKQLKDDRGCAAIVGEARASLMQSNLTEENYIGKMTLTHFKKYITHYVAHDEVVADGSRDISLNPVFKDKYKKEDSKMVITDLNQYLIEGKPLEKCQNRVRAADARKHMEIVRRNNQRVER